MLRQRRVPKQATGRRLCAPRQVSSIAAVGLGLALLLNAGPMTRSAESSPFGLRRTVALSVLGPISRVSGALGLDRPRAALDTALGRSDGANQESSGGETRLAAGPVATATPEPELAPIAQSPALRTSRRVTLRPVRHPWTVAQPLRLWVGGDSVAGFLSIEMVNIAGESGVISARGHYKISTGLSRPDYYDWPAHLGEDMAQYDPEVVVFMVGANDDQPLAVGNDVYSFGSEQWRAEYARRVGQVMDMLTAQHRLVFWVGQPSMRSPDFGDRMNLMDSIYAAQAATRPDVTFVDTRPVMSDGDGHYNAYLPDSGGQLTLMRADDGIHLTPAGGTRLAQAVLNDVRQRWQQNEVSESSESQLF